ncbi:MAG: 4Fe-4S binding protein [Desulfovibrionales bacterium]
MVILNNDSFPQERVHAVVNPERCDGCAFCAGACPSEAIEIIGNADREGKRIAFVYLENCEGCGVCQATCPKEAITIPGLEPARLRDYIAAAVSV